MKARLYSNMDRNILIIGEPKSKMNRNWIKGLRFTENMVKMLSVTIFNTYVNLYSPCPQLNSSAMP